MAFNATFLILFFFCWRERTDIVALFKTVFLKVTFCVQEMSDFVRKDIKIPETFTEAQTAVDEIYEKYKQAVFHNRFNHIPII